MRRLLTIGFLLLAATANAQPRPGAFTTLSTTGTITDGGLLVVNGAGTSTFSASNANQQQIVLVRNTAAGVASLSALSVGNDVSTGLVSLQAYSSTFTPSVYRFANGAGLVAVGAGGLSITSSTGTNLGLIRFYVADGGTEVMRLLTSAGVVIGGTTDPGAKSLQIDGGGTISLTGSTFANLGVVGSTANGTMIFCTDCTPATSPCTATGSGSMAFRQNGAWKCF